MKKHLKICPLYLLSCSKLFKITFAIWLSAGYVWATSPNSSKVNIQAYFSRISINTNAIGQQIELPPLDNLTEENFKAEWNNCIKQIKNHQQFVARDHSKTYYGLTDKLFFFLGETKQVFLENEEKELLEALQKQGEALIFYDYVIETNEENRGKAASRNYTELARSLDNLIQNKKATENLTKEFADIQQEIQDINKDLEKKKSSIDKLEENIEKQREVYDNVMQTLFVVGAQDAQGITIDQCKNIIKAAIKEDNSQHYIRSSIQEILKQKNPISLKREDLENVLEEEIDKLEAEQKNLEKEIQALEKQLVDTNTKAENKQNDINSRTNQNAAWKAIQNTQLKQICREHVKLCFLRKSIDMDGNQQQYQNHLQVVKISMDPAANTVPFVPNNPNGSGQGDANQHQPENDADLQAALAASRRDQNNSNASRQGTDNPSNSGKTQDNKTKDDHSFRNMCITAGIVVGIGAILFTITGRKTPRTKHKPKH